VTEFHITTYENGTTSVWYTGTNGQTYTVVFLGPNTRERATDYIQLIKNQAYYAGLER